jgi:hypothetical protein
MPGLAPLDGNAGSSSTNTNTVLGTGLDLPDNKLADREILNSQAIAQELKPGDLGDIQISILGETLQARSLRQIASENLPFFPRFRYRGQRESFKFQLIIQSLSTTAASMYLQLRTKFYSLRNSETQIQVQSTTNPSTSELSQIYHVMEQITFKEWLLIKDTDERWFNP